jgi:hypothetical protein
MLWNTITAYLQPRFDYYGVAGNLVLISAGLALAFGIIWLIGHRPPFLKEPLLWITAIASALLTVLATAFIFIPLNYFYSQWLGNTFDTHTLANMVLVWSIPIVLVIGLVQEGAKMVPMLFWRTGDEKPDIRFSMMIGAVAGAGYGIFEAFYSYNQVFKAGWGWSDVTTGGITQLLPFWIYFWMIACHIGISALLGYGLGKGKGGVFYALAAFLHALLSYAAILASNGYITGNQLGIITAAAGIIIIGLSLWLRWRKFGESTPAAVTETAPSKLRGEETPLTALPEQGMSKTPGAAILSPLKQESPALVIQEIPPPPRQANTPPVPPSKGIPPPPPKTLWS